MLQRAARNAYSWWWASHIRTKQSKWLEDNLQDMEEKVDYILKIIDEEGDSFAQRAEMYYKKRPELVNFVEDSFRGYRALAERYDHLSKELQSANRTIASVYPERTNLALDDEDGENFAPAETSTSFDESSKQSNNLPVAPRLSIPKVVSSSRKVPSRLMSKKGLVKININDAGVAAITKSGLSKSEALKEIDRIQKGILALQTEKEFVKSSYEIGVAKYWEIENQVTEMQAQVSSLQDEFGIGTYIEDDEARKLTTATALKSCQDTLARLKDKQKQAAEDAILENGWIQQVRERFELLKQEIVSNNQAHEQVMIEHKKLESVILEKKVEIEEENYHSELLHSKSKEELKDSSGSSLTVSELAEKVDELVEKAIKMEYEISSHDASVKRIRSERNQLQAYLRTLEEGKESFIENGDIKNSKIRELEEELCRVQSLMQCIRDQSNNLQTHFTETSCNLVNLTEKLLNIKPDEEIESTTLLCEMNDTPGNKPEKHYQAAEDKASADISNKREVKERSKSAEESTPHLVFISQELREREISGVNSEAGVLNKESEEAKKEIIADRNLVNSWISPSVRMSKQENGNEDVVLSASSRYEERSIRSFNQENNMDNTITNCSFRSPTHESSEKGCKQLHEMLDPPQNSLEDMGLQMKRETIFQSDPKSYINDCPFERQDTVPQRSGKHEGPMGDEMIISTHMGVKDGDKKEDNIPFRSTFDGCAEEDHFGLIQDKNSDDVSRMLFFKYDSKFDKDKNGPGKSSGQSDLSNQSNCLSENIHVEGGFAATDHPGKKSRVDDASDYHDISTISRDTEAKHQKASYDENNYQASEELYKQFLEPSRNGQVKQIAENNGPAMQCEAHKYLMAPHDISTVSRNRVTCEELGGDHKVTNSEQPDLHNISDEVSRNVEEKDLARTGLRKGSEAHGAITAHGEISSFSIEMKIKEELAISCKASSYSNCEESDFVNHYRDVSRVNGSAKSDEGERVDGQEGITALLNTSAPSRNPETVEILKIEDKSNENSGKSVRYNPFDDDVPENIPEKDVAEQPAGGKGSHECIVALHNVSTPSRDTVTADKWREGKTNNKNSGSEAARYNPFDDDVFGNVQEKFEGSVEGGKDSEAHQGILALHDISNSEELMRQGKISRTSSGQSERCNSFDRNVEEIGVAGTITLSRNRQIDEELSSECTLDQGKSQKAQDQDSFQNGLNDREKDDQPNWKELFLNGLDDRERVLLQEYTTILRNYKEVKKTLSEVEKKKRASLFQYAIQMKLLKSTNAAKDSTIQSLQKKLTCCHQMDRGGTPDSNKILTTDSFRFVDVESLDSNQKINRDYSSRKPTFESMEMMEESTSSEDAKISCLEEEEEVGIQVTNPEEPHTFSTIEEKIRMDIDEILEENIEFWLRFSTSFHQIQKFQNTVQDLQDELVKVKEKKTKKKNQDESTNPCPLSEIRPIYRHLREIQTELTLWLEHNAVLKDDLENRLSSLSGLHEEMMRFSNADSKKEETELTNFQAAKFQGEFLNMKRENNKVADELQAGMERVTNLQVEIQKTLKSLDEELGFSSTNQQTKNRYKIPLRTFLFGVKLKRQRPSIFACVTPAMQKQYSDLQAQHNL